MQPRIVVARQRPWWLKPALIGGGGFLLALGAWGLYLYTRASTVSDFEHARLEVEQLREERRGLTRDLRMAREQIRELEEQVAYVERSQQIDTEACNEVRASLGDLQAEASDLREQLAFYRGIVAPEQSRAGVRVYEFKMQPAATPDRYAYELVLIQSVRHDKRVAGRIDLELVGERGNAEVRLPWADVSVGDTVPNLVFSLKYFEEFAGEIAVPRNFEPVRVTVTLVPEGNGSPRVDESFDWERLVGHGGP
ncbi:MAG: DUF6776 family protein [Sinimarinibacterium flocculans]|uniref:Transmembrane protein n=1 Tax=Sinimarinibacterium flocculans TaxID=985250 RepID=A0A318EFI1_9GAMM|nr:DUF6776 family protein [Sinimarinibacterium flocculans]MEC9362255.1 DUF6776 family protein [Pseudomonadota bacterium]PXV70434.1 hypothetical protein C8D93_102292 [Sinimarinibacterium flocculans]